MEQLINSPVQPSTIPEQKELPARNWWKTGFFLMLFMIVVIIGLLRSGFFESYQTKLIPTPVPTKVIQATPTTSSETANWKTYTNTKYGYSFKYPDSWFLNSEEPNIEIATVPVSQYLHGVGSPPHGAVWVTISTVESRGSDGESTISVGPNAGIINLASYKENKGNILQLQGGFWQDDSQQKQITDRAIINQILSTFTFLDQKQTDETVSWKTFTYNKQQPYTYEIKYPLTWKFNTMPDSLVDFGPTYFQSPGKSFVYTKVTLIQTGGFSYDQIVGNDMVYLSNIKDENIIVNNYKGRKISGILTEKALPDQVGYFQEIYYIRKNDVLYIISLVQNPEESYQNIFQTMLSTFKFTN